MVARLECPFDFLAENSDRTLFFRVTLRPYPLAEYVSPSVKTLLGYEPQEFYDNLLRVLEIVEPYDRPRLLHFLEDPTTCAVPFRIDFCHRDGRRIRLEYDYRVVDTGDELRVEGVAQDATEGIEKEEAFERLTAELNEARVETLQRLALAAEYRDDQTNQHTQRVAETCAVISKTIGLPDERTQVIRLAAPLHDVGKIGIPDRILLKPGPLTKAEFEEMKTHTTIGAAILSGSNSSILRMGADIALAHHERWDGSGYPRGLAGEDIFLPARILAVADVLDSLSHDRPYKRAWPFERVVEEIRRGRGSQFDPDVVDALIDVFEGRAETRMEVSPAV